MLRILFFSFPFILLSSCKSDQKPASVEVLPETEVSHDDVAIPFAGNWISEDYFIKLTSSGSPRKAQEGSEDCFIHIPGSLSQATSMIYNFHEAGPQLAPKQHKGTYQLWEKDNGSLVQVLYTVESIAPDKIKLGGKTFLKINPAMDGHQPKILEEILFKGIYTSKTGERVEFKKNGEVTGLAPFRYYAPLIDYFDAGLQVDQVSLGERKDQMENFGFKFKGRTLELYKLKCKVMDETDNRCLDVTFGEKIHQLTKQDQ